MWVFIFYYHNTFDSRLYQRLIGMDRDRSEKHKPTSNEARWDRDPPWSTVAINVALGRSFPQVHGKCIFHLKLVKL